jgi:hypothetical protein
MASPGLEDSWIEGRSDLDAARKEIIGRRCTVESASRTAVVEATSKRKAQVVARSQAAYLVKQLQSQCEKQQ